MMRTIVLAVMLAAVATAMPLFTEQDYDHHVMVHAQYDMYWTVVRNAAGEAVELNFGVRAQTAGWVGFGIGAGAGMAGADMVIFGLRNDSSVYFSDRNAAANGFPAADTDQSWEQVAVADDAGFRYGQFKRAVRPCDAQDIAVEDGTSTIVYSFHPTNNPDAALSQASFMQHTVRGSHAVNLLSESKHSLPAGYMTEELSASAFAVSAAYDTTYMCAGLELKSDDEYLLTGWDIKYSPAANIKYVHHVVVYACDTPADTAAFLAFQGDCDRDGTIPQSIKDCKGTGMPIMGWAVGGGDVVFPENTGLPFGSSGARYVVFEVHYDNPDAESFTDSSSLDYHYLAKSSATGYAEAFQFWTGSVDFVIPPNAEEYIEVGHMSAACSQAAFPADGVKIIAAFPHTHLYGKEVVARHIRGGAELPAIVANPNYDFNFQSYQFFEPVTVLPGDEIQVEALYDTSSFTSASGLPASFPLMEGESTRNEMALVLMLAVPVSASASMPMKLTAGVSTIVPSVFMNAFVTELKAAGADATVVDDAFAMYNHKLADGHAPGDDMINSVQNLAYANFTAEAMITWNAVERAAFVAAMDTVKTTGRYSTCMSAGTPFVPPYSISTSSFPLTTYPLAPGSYNDSKPCVPLAMPPAPTPTAAPTTPSIAAPLNFDINEGNSKASATTVVIIALVAFVLFTAAFVFGLYKTMNKDKTDENAEELARRRSTYVQRKTSSMRSQV